MLVKLQAVVVVVLVSKETKFEVDTTSIILSYLLYHFRNVNKELFKNYLQHTKPCKPNTTKLIKFSSSFPLAENFRRQGNIDRIRYGNENSEIFQDKRMWEMKKWI